VPCKVGKEEEKEGVTRRFVVFIPLITAIFSRDENGGGSGARGHRAARFFSLKKMGISLHVFSWQRMFFLRKQSRAELLDYSLKDMYNIFTAKRGKIRGAYRH
jgi:hypothetical protein